jgi:hypothetical protein
MIKNLFYSILGEELKSRHLFVAAKGQIEDLSLFLKRNDRHGFRRRARRTLT